MMSPQRVDERTVFDEPALVNMLANERFVQNAPGDVVEAERAKLERYRSELAALES